MTDVDDLRFLANNAYQMGDFQMSASADELRKRVSAASLTHMSKAAMHLGKAADCQKTAMSCCKALGGLHKDMAMAAKAAIEAGGDQAAVRKAVSAAVQKAAEGFDSEKAMDHLHKMHGALTAMEDHHEMAEHHLGKAAGGTEQRGSAPDWGDQSQGHAPVDRSGDQYPADRPVSGKGAGYTREMVDQLLAEREKSARAEAELEVLRRMPGTANRARLFDVGKAATEAAARAGTSDPRALLLDGVDVRENMSPDETRVAAGRMIGNMFKNARVFAKNPATDPNFRGLAG